jgi:hypothetical protein
MRGIQEIIPETASLAKPSGHATSEEAGKSNNCFSTASNEIATITHASLILWHGTKLDDISLELQLPQFNYPQPTCFLPASQMLPSLAALCIGLLAHPSSQALQIQSTTFIFKSIHICGGTTKHGGYSHISCATRTQPKSSLPP